MGDFFRNIGLGSTISNSKRLNLSLMGRIQDEIALYALVFLRIYVVVEVRSYGRVHSLTHWGFMDGRSRVVKSYASTVINAYIGFPFDMPISMC